MGKKKKTADDPLAQSGSTPTPLRQPGIYLNDDGVPILTNSMMTAFRRCTKQAEYKYIHRLKPKRMGQPLKRGSWVHELLEVHGKGGDWRAHHNKLTAQFELMFDEEKEYYGDMPTEILHLMNSYFWHYKRDPWIYHESEMELEGVLPNGVILRAQVDNLIENEFGLWLVDHKTHKSLPNLRYRMLDTQSPLYMWLAWQNNIPVRGFIWNYLRWKVPTKPQMAYVGTARERLSTKAIDTDYPTYKAALKGYGLNPKQEPYAEKLAYLKKQRYTPGEVSASTFFQRSVIEKSPELLDRVIKEAVRTADRMNTYDFGDPEAVERTVGRHCEYLCSYTDLCGMELFGANTVPLLKQNFEVGDPLSYYHDKAGDVEGREDI